MGRGDRPRAPEPEPARERYRVAIRLSKRDHKLLAELVEKTDYSLNQTMIFALRHFYWTVLRERKGAYVWLPPEVQEEAGRPQLLSSPTTQEEVR